MKFGFRTPSWKRSFSAMTRGAATRALKKAILPGYGQKGKGYYTGFKKSAYSKVYNQTTVSVFDFFKSNKQKRNYSSRNISNELQKCDDKLLTTVATATIDEGIIIKQLIIKIIISFEMYLRSSFVNIV